MRFSILFITALCLLSLSISKVQAAFLPETIRITCHQKGACEQVAGPETYFSYTNIVPSQSFSRTIEITNKRIDEGCTIGIRAQEKAPENVSIGEKLLLHISTGQTTLLTIPLSELFSDPKPIYLDTLNPKITREYLWSIQFSPLADNNYQGSTTSFDLMSTITCDEATREPIPTQKPDDIADSRLPECHNLPPKEAPQLTLKELENNPTQTKLVWQKISSADEYFVTFGSTDGELKYSSNIPGSLLEYTAVGLNRERSYFFSVAAKKGCAVGPSSPLVILEKRTPATIKPTLAKTDRLETLQSPTTATSGSVLGTQTDNFSLVEKPAANTKKRLILPQFYMGLIPIILLLLFISKRRKKAQSPQIKENN